MPMNSLKNPMQKNVVFFFEIFTILYFILVRFLNEVMSVKVQKNSKWIPKERIK